jgi:hypothetical protein
MRVGGSLLSLPGAGGSLPGCGGVRVAPRPPPRPTRPPSGCGGGPTLHSAPAPLPSSPSSPPPSRRSKGEEAVAGGGSSAAATYLPGVDERRVGSTSFMRGCRIRCMEARSGTMVNGYRRASSPSLTRNRECLCRCKIPCAIPSIMDRRLFQSSKTRCISFANQLSIDIR